MPLKEPIQGALTNCPTPMNFVSSAFTRSPALPASRALCRNVSWCPRRNSCSCRRHWATRTFKVGTDATFKDLFGDWKLMPLALLTKRLSRTTLERGIQGTSWCAHCMPVLCCITNSDVAASCEELMRALDEVPLCKNWSPQHSSSFRALSAPRWQHSFVHAHPAAAWGLGQRGLEATCRITCPNSIRQVRQDDCRHMFKDVHARSLGNSKGLQQKRPHLAVLDNENTVVGYIGEIR